MRSAKHASVSRRSLARSPLRPRRASLSANQSRKSSAPIFHPFALTHLRVPIALASSAVGIPGDWRPCLSLNRVHPSGDPPGATAVAISADDRPDNCSIERRPTSCSSTQARPARDLNARNHKRTANSRAFVRQSIAPCSGRRRGGVRSGLLDGSARNDPSCRTAFTASRR